MGGGWGRAVDRFPEAWKAVLPADGVAAPDDLLVGLPVFADLPRYLLLDRREGGLADAADPGGLVLDPEQDFVLVFDGLLL